MGRVVREGALRRVCAFGSALAGCVTAAQVAARNCAVEVERG